MNKKRLLFILFTLVILALPTYYFMSQNLNTGNLAGLAYQDKKGAPVSVPKKDNAQNNEIFYGDSISLRSADSMDYLSKKNESKKNEVEYLVIEDPETKKNRVKFNDTVVIKSGNDYLTGFNVLKFASGDWSPGKEKATKFKIINPTNSASTEMVKANDRVYFLKVKESYVNFPNQHSEDDSSTELARVAKDQWSGYVIAPKDYYRNWMAATPEIHNKLLKEITFPASHDSGARVFSNSFSNEPETAELKAFLDKTNTFVNNNESLKAIGIKIDLSSDSQKQIMKTVNKDMYIAIKGLSKCTDSNISEQLDQGIRWFDIRVDLRNDGAYIHHFLTGEKMDGVLDSIRTFISSTQGEILFVEMSHFVSDPKNSSDHQNMDAFVNSVKSKLGEFAYLKELDGNEIINNPFNKRYNEVVGSTGSSKVVLILDSAKDDKMYWSLEQLGIGDGGDGSYSYDYSDTTDKKAMITGQKGNFTNAQKEQEIFTLWYTLTTNKKDSSKIVIGSISDSLRYALYDEAVKKIPDKKEISDAIKAINYIPFVSVDDPVEEFKKSLKKEIASLVRAVFPENTAGYLTTYHLSQRANPDLHKELYANFQNPNSGNNKISVIFADFNDESMLVETAIQYSRMPAAK